MANINNKKKYTQDKATQKENEYAQQLILRSITTATAEEREIELEKLVSFLCCHLLLCFCFSHIRGVYALCRLHYYHIISCKMK